MRQIKFRYWDSFNEVMQHCDTEYKDYLSKFFIEYYDVLRGENNPILMQFTGLIDKNGKEIYDGDLVRSFQTLYEIHNCVGGFECQVHRELKAGGTIEGSTFDFSCLTETNCEVIGNIHEHPHLLSNQAKG